MRHSTGSGHRPSWIALLLGLTLCPASAWADSGTEWGKRALRLQNQIDNAAPFPDTMWVGTHNSFNSPAWDSAYKADPNQKNTPREQLRQGVREIVFDIHWSTVTTRMLLCHGSCSGAEKTLREGLDEIRDWLDEGNRDEVVMLKIEAKKGAIDDKYTKLANQIEGAIGARIYKPSHHGIASGCDGLNPSKVSKQAILDAGKNVLVLSTPENGCPNESAFNEWVFSGFRFDDGTSRLKFDKPSSPGDCETLKASIGGQHMMRQYDSATWYSIADGNNGTVEIRKGNVEGYMACGLNVFEMFNFNGEGSATTREWMKPQELVWSWSSGEPNNSGGQEHCAVSGTDDRFNDLPCDQRHAFACRDAAGTWKVTGGYGTFSEGDAVCQKFFGSGFSFATPVNARENKRLLQVKPSGAAVWLNYQDLSMEGQWIANSGARLPYVTVASRGGGGGSTFDDKEEMTIDLYRSQPRRVRKVVIRSGRRVDRLSLEYSDGAVVAHGGVGGSDHTLSLPIDEHVNRYEVCVDKHDGSNRVFYLKLWTNKGNTVAGGSRDGSCTSGTFEGKHLFGFHGRSGAGIDALGFYFRAR